MQVKFKDIPNKRNHLGVYLTWKSTFMPYCLWVAYQYP